MGRITEIMMCNKFNSEAQKNRINETLNVLRFKTEYVTSSAPPLVLSNVGSKITRQIYHCPITYHNESSKIDF